MTASAQSPAPAAPAAGPKFNLVLGLSPAAVKKLTAMGEAITVSAMYEGEPNKAGEKKAIEGVIPLGEENLERKPVAAGDRMTFVGKGFKTADLKWVKPGGARVLINVYSARKVADDNLLDCAIYEGTLAEAAAKPVLISCKLIDE